MIAAEAEVHGPQAHRLWNDLARGDDRGRAYLESRALWPDVLEAAGVVRYMRSGAPAVALRHLAIGAAVVNVVSRTLPPAVAAGRPKALGQRGMPTSGVLVGDLDEIHFGRDAVVCEGIADSLAAVLAWPFAVVCGAHGAGRLAEVAAEVAARVAETGGRMWLVADDDVTGVKAGAAACQAAIAAGLRLGVDLMVLEAVDLDGHHDLAAGWAAGWRP